MKKTISILLLLALLVSFVPYSFAEDTFKVTQNVVKSKDDIKNINVVLPNFEGFNGADKVNKKVLDIALDAIGEANAMAKSMMPIKKEIIEKGETASSMVVTLDMVYDYVKLGDVLSVQLNIYSYYGGAHGTSQIVSITSNTDTGEVYKFKDLFKENADYNSVITKYILKEIEKEPEQYFSDYEKTISSKDGNYEFYIDGDKLVVYFGLYNIAPYAAGIRYFVIDSGDIKDILKDDIYNSIKDGKERGFINYNGKNINSDKEIVNSDGTYLLPLREIAEILGYKVDWNKDDGVIVDGKVVSITPQQIINGATYVPLSYFSEVLNDNVSLGFIGNEKTIVRVYGKEYNESSNYRLASEYESPETAEDAVKMYAEAVEKRNGMIQYGLMDDSMRQAKFDDFNDLGFVTGVSSPWVDGYDISQLEENLYNIKFTYKTSVPTDEFISEEDVRLIEDGQFIKISSIVEK
jgi:hypothetical protein